MVRVRIKVRIRVMIRISIRIRTCALHGCFASLKTNLAMYHHVPHVPPKNV